MTVFHMRLQSTPIRARTRKLSARWTCDRRQDLHAFHSIDAEDELTDILPTMRQIKVNKAKLLAIIKKNREEHREVFLEAQKAYRQRVIETLDEQLKQARCQQPVNLQVLVMLQAPQDHTADYDRSIQMLEMSVDKQIVISEQEFQNYVQDTWEWSRQWATSNMGYVSRNSRSYGKLSALANQPEY